MSNTGRDELTSEPEVTEELITPLRNRPWRYIPQFTDEECRWLIVDKTSDEEKRREEKETEAEEQGQEEEEEEGSHEGQGLLQYYRHKRALDYDDDNVEDMNGDLEVMELAKVVYGRPSPSAATDERQEVYEEPIVPVRIVRRTDAVDFGSDPEGGKPNGGSDAATPDPDGIWKGDVDESLIEVEENRWKTSAVPPAHLERPTHLPPGETGSMEGASLSFADSVLQSVGINDLGMEKNEGHVTHEPTGNSIFASGEARPGSGGPDPPEWDEESKQRPDVPEAIADPEENDEPRVEVVEELLVETRTVRQTRPFPVFAYTSDDADILAEPEARDDVTENVISGEKMSPASLCSATDDASEEPIQVRKEALLSQGEVKVGPGTKGGTLPPSPDSSRVPPEKPARARRTKSETFLGFIRRKSKSKERGGAGGEGGGGKSEEKNEKKKRGEGEEEEESVEKKSHGARASPTTLRSKKSKGDDSPTQPKKPPSLLQKLGFGRSSKKTEKQNPDHRKKSPEDGDGEEEEEEEDGKHVEAAAVKAKASTLPKQSSSSSSSSSAKKTNIRIFEIMGKNSHEGSSESTPDVSRTPPPQPSSSSSHPTDSLAASVVRVDVVRDTVGSETGAGSPLYSSQIGSDRNAAERPRDVLYDGKKKRMEGGVRGGGGDGEEEEGGVQVTDVGPRVVGTEDDLAAMFQKRSYIVAVAIDFGTAFSGYAFCFLRDPESVHMMGRWEDGDPGLINQKTPTTLLLTPEGRFHSFGFTARNNYHDLSPEDAQQWLYFDRFKMALYESQDFSETMTIEAANGKRFPGLDAISLALRFFRDHALAQISSQSETRILNDDVLWIVTVPAIWNASAKQMMRLAAYKAGLVSPDRPDQLQMALEPEAASVHIRRLQLRHLVPEKPVVRPLSIREENVDKEELEFLAAQFNQVVRYMIVDSGGGTVDITVHEMNFMNRRLQELHVATGGPHGSFSIDRDFERLLELIFGPELIQSFRRERPSGWIGLMMAFESRKRAADPRRTNPLNVALPFSFIEFHRKTKGTTVEEAIKAYGDSRVRWSSQGMLRLSQEAMRNLFSRTIDKIKQTIENVLGAVKGIDYIFLVGGLSESSVFQCEIREHFRDRVRKVVIPQEANLAVIKGALAFGLDPTVIAVRRSKLTYGAAVLNRFVHGKHPPSKLVTAAAAAGDEAGTAVDEWCRDVFDVFVGAGQVVRAGERVVRQYIPAAPSQKRIVIGIYCTEDLAPRYVSDPGVRKCGNVSLDLASTTTTTTADSRGTSGPAATAAAAARRRIQAELVFAETEIRVTATDVLTQRKVNASIDFLNV